MSKLRKHEGTRQAVITLWDPNLDNVKGKNDYPCTVALGFTRHDENLSAHVTMRSNDVWLGLPYDMFQFTQLQLTLCNILGLRPGTYTHTAWSMHLYDRDLVKTYDLTIGSDNDDAAEQPDGLGRLALPVEHLWTRARTIAREPHLAHDLWDVTKSEEWYVDILGGV